MHVVDNSINLDEINHLFLVSCLPYPLHFFRLILLSGQDKFHDLSTPSLLSSLLTTYHGRNPFLSSSSGICLSFFLQKVVLVIFHQSSEIYNQVICIAICSVENVRLNSDHGITPTMLFSADYFRATPFLFLSGYYLMICLFGV